MKIIKHGKPKSTAELFCCFSCGCEFEAGKGEYEEFFDRNEHYYRCKCPECGSRASCITLRWHDHD